MSHYYELRTRILRTQEAKEVLRNSSTLLIEKLARFLECDPTMLRSTALAFTSDTEEVTGKLNAYLKFALHEGAGPYHEVPFPEFTLTFSPNRKSVQVSSELSAAPYDVNGNLDSMFHRCLIVAGSPYLLPAE